MQPSIQKTSTSRSVIMTGAAAPSLTLAFLLFLDASSPATAQARPARDSRSVRNTRRIAQSNAKSVAPIAPATGQTQAANVPTEARVALERGRQIAAQGFGELAEPQFKRAALLAPKWAEAHRELARFYANRSRWNSASREWRQVLFLARNDREAKAQLARAQRLAPLPFKSRDVVTLGENSDNAFAESDPERTTSLAAEQPRLAQADPSAPATDGTQAPQPAPSDVVPPASLDTTAPSIATTPDAANPDATLTMPQATGETAPTDVAPPATNGATQGDVEAATPQTQSTPGSVGITTNVVPPPVRANRAAPIRAAFTSSGVGDKRLPLNLSFARPARVSKKRQAAAFPFVNRAAKALAARQYPQALTLYRQGYASDPFNEYAGRGIAETLLIQRKLDEAARAAAKALASRPNDPRTLRILADALTFNKRYAQAINVNDGILRSKPRDFNANYQNAQIYTYTRQYVKADPFYRRALTARPNDSAVYATYGEALTYADNPRARDVLLRALQLQRNNPRALLALGNYYNFNANYALAIPRYRALLQQQPQNASARVGLGDSLTFSGQPETAAAQYRIALQNNPNNAQARLGLGRALVLNRQNEAGATELTRVLKSQPNNVEALQLLASAQAARPSATSALATYSRLLALQTKPRDKAATYASIGALQARDNRLEAARAAYEQAIRLAPDDNNIAIQYAQTLFYREQTLDAQTVVRGVLERTPGDVRAQILQLAIESRLGNVERAQALARQLSATEPTTPEDALLLANALRQNGEPQAAQRVLERLASQSGNDISTQLRIAKAVSDAGEFEGAATLYRRILTDNPSNVEARLNLARVLSYQNQYDQAQAQVEQILQSDPSNAEALVLSATIQSYRGTAEGLTAAETGFNQVLQANPQNPQALAGSGFILSARKRYSEAVTQYRAALQNDPGNLESLLGLGRNLYYARQIDESISTYQELLRRAPNDNRVRLELGQIFLDRNRLSEAEGLFTQVLANAQGVLLSRAESTVPSPNGPIVVTSVNALLRPSLALRMQAAPFSSFVPSVPHSGRASKRASRQKTEAKRVAMSVLPRVKLAQAAPSSAPTSIVGGTSPEAPASGASSPATTSGTAPSSPEAGIPQAGLPPEADAAPEAGSAPGMDANQGATADQMMPVPSVSAPALDAPSAPTPLQPAPDALTSLQSTASSSDQVAALRGLGEVRRRQNNFADAIVFYRRALDIDAADVPSRLGLAQALRGSGDFATALTEVETAAASAPTNLAARVLRAQLLGDTGQTQQAQTELDALVAGLETPTLEDYLSLAAAFSSLRNYDAALQMLQAAQRDFPTDATVPRRYAETLAAARRYPEAAAVYDQLIALDPQDADAILGRARVANYANQLIEADTFYRRVLEREPNNFAALAELADILSRRGNYPASIGIYQTAIGINPEDLGTQVELGRVLRYNQQFAESEAQLNQVLSRDGRFVPALVERGILRGQQNDTEPALADLREALSISPNDLTAQFGLAEVLSYAGNYDESIRLYRAALQRDPSNEKGRIELGLALSYSGQNQAALSEIDAVLKGNPQNVNAQIARASTLVRARRAPEAITLYRTILQSNSQNRRAQLGLGDAFVAARRYPEALSVYDRLIQSEPQNRGYRIARARALGYSGQNRRAVAELRPLVNPASNASTAREDIAARSALAEAMTNSGERSLQREAVSQYRRILAVQPSNAEARVGLGRALSYTGDYPGSRAELRRVLQAQPQNAGALYALGENERFAGRPFDARDFYKKSLQIDPSNDQAMAGLRVAQRATQSSLTVYRRGYLDTNGVRLVTYGAGPTIRTRQGTFGLTAETGSFSDNGAHLDRRALNFLVARDLGPLQGRLLLSQVRYGGGGGSRTLFDATLQRATDGGRKRVFVNLAHREVIETLGALLADIEATNYGAGFAYPLGDRFDLEAQASRLNYSDGNKRNILAAALMYRLHSGAPTFRVGLGYRFEDSLFQPPLDTDGVPIYYAPQGYRSPSFLADYVIDRGKTRLGLFGSVPLNSNTGDGGFNRPAKTLFGYFNYDLNDLIELYLNGGIVRSPDFDSNDFTLGANFRFK